MRIAVIADTHDHYPAGLPARLRKADEIWHLGDVCDPATLAAFELVGVPMTVVLGNNDLHAAWPLTRTLVRGGLQFHLVHIAPRHAPVGADFVLSGHTHVPSDETDPRGVRWLNPGCITRPRARVRSFAWLHVVKGHAPRWELEML